MAATHYPQRSQTRARAERVTAAYVTANLCDRGEQPILGALQAATTGQCGTVAILANTLEIALIPPTRTSSGSDRSCQRTPVTVIGVMLRLRFPNDASIGCR